MNEKSETNERQEYSAILQDIDWYTKQIIISAKNTDCLIAARSELIEKLNHKKEE